MKEEINFVKNKNRELFVHINIPEKGNANFFLFMNPILDEKQRTHRFYSETARRLVSLGYLTVRWDYYGTGDSKGELSNFNIENTIDDAIFIINYIRNRFTVSNTGLFGIRFGADLALEITKKCNYINITCLIEPVLKGSNFLEEITLKRQFYFKLNNLIKLNTYLELDGSTYEDFQGYPLSQEVINYITNYSIESLTNIKSELILVNLNTVFSKNIKKLLQSQDGKNQNLKYCEMKYPTFWSSLEPIDTKEITDRIIDFLFNPQN